MAGSTRRADVIVIGAGPAGSTAATLLARAGRHVLLIEKERFPREKVCGGCLSGAALEYLRNLLGPSRRLPGTPARQITFVIGAHRLTCRPNGRSWMTLRAELDALLAQTAVEAGAEVHHGESATLEPAAEGWHVRVGERRFRPNWILLGSGITGVARALRLPSQSVRRRLLSQQWTQPADGPLPGLGETELHWLRGGYVGLATPSPGRCVVALAAEAERVRGESPLAGLLRLNPHATVWQALASEMTRSCHRSGAAGFPWRPRRPGAANVLLIGDAAGFEEPYSGEGIGQAMRSATFAAQAVLAGGDVLGCYTRLMHGRHCAVLERTRWISRMLRLPLVHGLAEVGPVLPGALLGRVIERVHVGAGA